MTPKVPTVLFICPHGAAKSVIAANYLRHAAARRGIALDAVAVGTDPDAAVPPAVVAALDAEGIDVSAHRPRRVTPMDFAAAHRVVTIGAELGSLTPPLLLRWNDGTTCRS